MIGWFDENVNEIDNGMNITNPKSVKKSSKKR